ncbi:uncharacterized protein LOC109906230 [Oncorhynchus kisutch]|uniref:uncharacterized protein LOC109906230 n=1 Tax=Oncorhynchus kisutch TaxID=8019 RepID=UPI0012DE26EC|nr:uncharacterized protein LOC109906230 [Oncorhynchus kisutch]
MKDTSSKKQDTIAISTHINSGPPARYQLVTKKQNLDDEGLLRRCTFGERDHSKLNKTILIVRETGTGKSTLINAMVNYILGVEWEHKVWFEIIEEEKGIQSESQTTAITMYEVFGCEGLRVPYSLTIIDTPGYGDTRGIQEDQLISEKLLEMFRSTNGIHQIDAVGLVVKATENRLNDRQKYIFDAVLSIFGKDMEKNIVTLITHSDGRPPKNALGAITRANFPCAKNDRNQPVHFTFNNCQCEVFAEDDEDCEEYVSSQKTSWDKGAKSMDKFFNYKIEPKSVKMTEGVLRERKYLEACVSNLREWIHMVDLKQDEIKQTQEALKEHKNDIEKNNNFTYTVEEPYKEKVPTKEGNATTCTVCEENCHYPGCWWVSNLSWCSVMQNNCCTVCTGKCHYTDHVKGYKMYVAKTRQVTRTYEELKNKYELEKGNVIIRLQAELEQFTLQNATLVEESYQHLIKLDEIALKSISLSAALHLGFLIDKMKETGETKKVQKLEEMKKRAEEHKGALDYFKAGV